jgi:hypothetical protein
MDMRYKPLINYSTQQPQPRRSKLVAAARIFMIIMGVLMIVGLHWRGVI